MTNKNEKNVFFNKLMENILSEEKKISAIHEFIVRFSVCVKIHRFVKSTADYKEYVVKKGYPYNEKSFKDLTAYECFCNEMYFNNKLQMKNKRRTIDLILQRLQKELPQKYKKKFCIIISVDDGEFENITVFFHTYRQNEAYLDENLSEYEQPVLYALVEP